MNTEVSRCNKCGICLSVCPVYKEMAQEQVSPRAKVKLIQSYRNSGLPASNGLQELVNKCLMCGSCTANCPSGVDHPGLYRQMRDAMVQERGEDFAIRCLVFLLARESRLGLAAGFAHQARKLLPASLEGKKTVGDLFLGRLPKMNRRPFRQQLPEEIPPLGRERGRVVYFTGCGTNYIYESTGHATVRLLTAMGYRVMIPKGQTCCSLPMLYHGGGEKGRPNIIKNIEHLPVENIEAVIVDCPTCGSALKKEYPAILRQWQLDHAKADLLAAKICNLLTFIEKRQDLLPISEERKNNPPVTYHAPCHLKNGSTPADALLAKLPGIDFRPAQDGHSCCGGGGTFWYEFPEVATNMALAKVKGARASGAEIWLTECPVCRLNLAGRLEKEDKLRLEHPATFLADLLEDNQ